MLKNVKLYLTIGAVACLVLGSAFCYITITNLKADLATQKNENTVLALSVSTQHDTILSMQRDYKSITKINNSLKQFVIKQQHQIADLNNKFTINAKGESRDFGDIARAKPGLVNRIVNKGSTRAFRCLELVTGAELIKNESIASVCGTGQTP